MEYIQITENNDLPVIKGLSPFKCIVVIDDVVSKAKQSEISKWLVESGCMYMMAWGIDCSSWDDSVDVANINQFDFSDIPEEAFVLTTWHVDEPLKEVMWFAKHTAWHEYHELKNCVILHLSVNNKAMEFSNEYQSA